jgi:4'-phosphopantetheinyl transferase
MQVKPIDLRIADRFFSEQEILRLEQTEENKRLHVFYDLWTAKESYIKALGRGLSIKLDSFTVNINSAGAITVQSQAGDNYFIKQYVLAENYKTSVCSMSPSFPEHYFQYTVSELMMVIDSNYS